MGMSCQAMNIRHDIEGNQQTCHAVETRETVETVWVWNWTTRRDIPIFIPILGGQEPGAGFLFLLGFMRNPKGTFLIFLLFLRVGTLAPLRNRNSFLLP